MKRLCLALAVLLAILSPAAFADDNQCIPWIDVDWTAKDVSPSGNVYVGVYECAYTLSLERFPQVLTGSLIPLDASKAERLWTKALNDCWSFYGVYPQETVDETTGEETCLFEQADVSISLRFSGRNTDDPVIEFTVTNEHE